VVEIAGTQKDCRSRALAGSYLYIKQRVFGT
jgi:hypothetical protein